MGALLWEQYVEMWLGKLLLVQDDCKPCTLLKDQNIRKQAQTTNIHKQAQTTEAGANHKDKA